jgi:diguanylate cyclase (GGDEF)-like protein
MELSWGPMLDKTLNDADAMSLPITADDNWALSLVAASRDLVCLCHEGLITLINSAGVQHLGGETPKKIIGRPFTDFVHADDRDTVQWLLDKQYQEQEPLTIKLLGIGKQSFDADTLFIPFGKNGEAGMVVQAHDISLRKERDERIQFQANYDTLTGLPNRLLFMDRLNQGLIRSDREGKKLALMFIDLDGFQCVNYTLGYHVGDLLLQKAAKRLTDCMRSSDTVARLGGDEFTIIMPSLDDLAQISLAAQRILDALEKPFQLNDEEAIVTGSIGITVFPDDASEASDLLRNADAAMYRAKDQGKATFHYYTADLNEEVKERVAIKTGLSKAMEREELSLHYQPKLDLKTDCFTGVEALMRWNSTELGFVAPVRFIPSLEEIGLVVEVGEWAIRQACEQHL